MVILEDARGPAGQAIYAIGDIHGRMDLLGRMLDRISQDIAATGAADFRIIFLGDYVDRGPASREVLDTLVGLRSDPRHLFLCGNHDEGFVRFVEELYLRGPFLGFGGYETAQSYGVDLDLPLEDARARLAEAVPPAHLALLRELQPGAAFGDFYFCHAGIRPGIPLDQQDPQDLRWIRSPFLDYREPHPAIIVHGHTPCETPEIRSNRINVDTGAFRTGVLTALVIEEDRHRILQVRAGD